VLAQLISACPSSCLVICIGAELMVVLAQEGPDIHFGEWPCKGQVRSASCGGRKRSVGRRQRTYGDARTRDACAAGHSPKPPIATSQRPAEEVELRGNVLPEDNAEDKKDDLTDETEEGLLFACNMIADWVDTVSNDICDAYVIEMMLPQELDGVAFESGDLEEEFWETVSDCDEADVLELDQVPQSSGLADPALDVDPVLEPILIDVHLPQEESQEMLLSPSPMTVSLEASPSSRSSTPSRSVRHRHRVIGGIVRAASPAWGTSFQRASVSEIPESPKRLKALLRPATTMKHAVSTSALAMDLGTEVGHDLGSATKPVQWRRGAGQMEIPSPSGFEQRCVKSKSLGALHVTSSNHGLGLAPPMSSTKRGLLPALSVREGSNADLISWSVSLTTTKRSGLRLVF